MSDSYSPPGRLWMKMFKGLALAVVIGMMIHIFGGI